MTGSRLIKYIGLNLVNGRAVGTFDLYDFDISPYTNQKGQTPLSLIVRNTATSFEKWVVGKGTPYYIYFYGSYPVKK